MRPSRRSWLGKTPSYLKTKCSSRTRSSMVLEACTVLASHLKIILRHLGALLGSLIQH